MLIPARVETKVFEHLQIFFQGLVEGCQVVANHEGAGASHKNHALCVAQIHRSSASDHDLLARQNEPETSDGLENLQNRQRRDTLEWRAFDGIKDVDRHNIRSQFFQRKGQFTAVLTRLTHADNAAGAYSNARFLEVANGLQPMFVSVRGAMIGDESF